MSGTRRPSCGTLQEVGKSESPKGGVLLRSNEHYAGYVLQSITGGVAVWRGDNPGRLGDALRIMATADEIKRWIDAR